MGIIIVKKPYSLSGEINTGFKHLGTQHDQKTHGSWATGKRDITDSPQFKKWFGDSKIVDENGKPLVVYHGGEKWNVFDAKRGSEEALWMTDEVGVAIGYADQYSSEYSEVKPLYAKIEKPLDLRKPNVFEKVFGLTDDQVKEKTGFGLFENAAAKYAYGSAPIFRKAIEYAKNNGFDGIIHFDTDVTNSISGTSYVVFSPKQVKLAKPTGFESDYYFYGHSFRAEGNQGAFDPEDPSILKEKHTTAMVCFDAEMTKIATDLPDKTDIVPDRHITLLYLGDSDSLLQSKKGIIDLLKSFSSEYAPIEGQFNGIAAFAKTLENDNKSPIVALYDSPALPGFRQALKKKFDTYNDFPEQTHGFTPHMTLGYTAEPYEFTGEFKPVKARFDKISLWWGDEHIDFELTGKTTAKSLQEAIVEGFKHLQGKHDQKTHGSWAGDDIPAEKYRSLMDQVGLWKVGLNSQESAAVDTWSVNSDTIQDIQLGKQKEGYGDIVKDFESALDRGIKYDGIVYRGLFHVPPKTIYDWLTSKEIKLNCHQSASISQEVAGGNDFFGGWGGYGGVLWKIKQKTGTLLGNHSGASKFSSGLDMYVPIDEKEVILPKNARYKIGKVFLMKGGKIGDFNTYLAREIAYRVVGDESLDIEKQAGAWYQKEYPERIFNKIQWEKQPINHPAWQKANRLKSKRIRSLAREWKNKIENGEYPPRKYFPNIPNVMIELEEIE